MRQLQLCLCLQINPPGVQEDVPLDLGNKGSRGGHAIAPGVEAMSSLSLPQMYLFILTWLATFLGLKKVWLNKCCLLVLVRASTSLTSRRLPPARSDRSRPLPLCVHAPPLPLLLTRFTVLD